MSGGQNYWPDELRYERARVAAAALSRGDWPTVGRSLGRPDHLLFPVLGLVPAALEQATGPDARVPALYFAAFSAASIVLLGLLMRRLGASPRASLLAAFLLAAS